MNTIGRLIETLASLVCHFRFAFHLRSERPFDDVADDSTWMGMWGGCFTRPVVDLDQDNLQMLTVQFRQWFGEHNSRSLFRPAMRTRRGALTPREMPRY